MYLRIALLIVPLCFIVWTSKTESKSAPPPPQQSIVTSKEQALDTKTRVSPQRSKPERYKRPKQEARPTSQSAPMRIRFYVQNEDGTIPASGMIKSDDCALRSRFREQHEIELYVVEECEFYAVRYDGVFQKHSDSIVIPYTPDGSVEQEFFFPTVKTGGFGISIEEDELGIRVLDIHSGSPAEEEELEYGDVIVELNGVPAGALTVEEFIANGTGPEGTSVSFRLLRDDPDDEPRTIIRRALTY